MRNLLATFSVCSLLALAACGGATAAGHYEIDKESFKSNIPNGSKMPAEMLDKMLASLTGALDLTADHAATMTMKMPPMMDMTATGKWALEGDKLTLTMKEKDGKEEAETGTLVDGVITLSKVEEGQTMKVVFRRK